MMHNCINERKSPFKLLNSTNQTTHCNLQLIVGTHYCLRYHYAVRILSSDDARREWSGSKGSSLRGEGTISHPSEQRVWSKLWGLRHIAFVAVHGWLRLSWRTTGTSIRKEHLPSDFWRKRLRSCFPRIIPEASPLLTICRHDFLQTPFSILIEHHRLDHCSSRRCRDWLRCHRHWRWPCRPKCYKRSL